MALRTRPIRPPSNIIRIATALSLLLLLAWGCGTSEGTPSADAADVSAGDGAGDTASTNIDWDAFFAPTQWEDDGLRRVTILHTNDLHGHLHGSGPLADYTPAWLGNDTTTGGFARLAALLERHRRDARPGESTLTVDAGDFTFGTAFGVISRETGVELRLLEALGYDATTLGNHEMDWTPPGTAALLSAGLDGDEHLQILAANLQFAEDDPDDDALAALAGTAFFEHRVLTLDNGVTVGIFGVLGEGAMSLSPDAAPLTVRPPAEVAAEKVALLRDTLGAELIVCLSHSGVSEGSRPGADENLARDAPGIDVIVGGHTHTRLPEPVRVGDTLIVQAGNYGNFLGRLILVERDGAFELESWDTLPIDDTVPGAPDITATIATYEELLDEHLGAIAGVAYRDALATTDIDLPQTEFAESALGDFIADAVRWATTQYGPDGPIEVAFEANGVIRAGLMAGATGKISVGDVLRIFPTGLGPDGELGFPMLAFHLTGAELKAALEVIVGLAPLVSDAFFLQVSGLRFEYVDSGPINSRVKAIYLGDEDAGYAATPISTDPDDPTLYRVAANLYIANMLAVLKDMTSGGIAIELRDAEGTPLAHPEDALVDIDPASPGVQELKLWRALAAYLESLPVDDITGLPQIPSRYAAPLGRMQVR